MSGNVFHIPGVKMLTFQSRRRKAMKTLKHNDNWFALSVKAFETEAVDGIDGYTLLRLPSRSGVSDEDKAKVDYVLWEMATTP